MTKPEMVRLAKAIALRHRLDPALVCAVCHHESNDWVPWATRYEPGFYRKYIEPMNPVQRFGKTISIETERTLRATSFGLMQCLGQVAREFGCRVEYLTELCDPELGIEYGCRKLADCVKKAPGTQQALLRYNGGGIVQYPEYVLRHLKDYA